MSVGAYKPTRLTATGDVTGASAGGVCGGINVKAGSAAGTVTVREGGASGAVLFTLTTAANGDGVESAIPFAYAGQLHLTLAGTGVEASAFV